MQIWVVVVAAGSGARFGAAKQFLPLGGSRVVDRAVATAARGADGLVLVVPEGTRWSGPPVDAVVSGGPTRAASVRAGLAAVPATADVIVVHDAARPLASNELFDSVIGAVARGADGAVPGIPLADTVKRVEGSRVVATVSRNHLVAVQTPQAFRADVLRGAHSAGGEDTDDAAMVEAAGGSVVVVPGDPVNFKITTREDLARAEALVLERERA